MSRKIAFFDIDGTLTSEIDGSVPADAADAIRRARNNGHLMFINTGRCMQNVEGRFRNVGFDGYVCGCGTNIYCTKDNTLQEILYINQNHSIVSGIRQYRSFANRNYDMSHDPESEDFTCDKFVVWFQNLEDIPAFRRVSDKYFECIDRGGDFREFVPLGFSKATGIQTVLDYYGLTLDDAYAMGDSNNDLSMLSYVKNSIAMGNSSPESLFTKVSYVTSRSSEGGIRQALEHFHFI